MRALLAVMFLACSSGPTASRSDGFVRNPPQHCVDVKYAAGRTLETARMCFRYRRHCEIGRQGALRYGRMGGAVAVSRCF